MFSAALSRIALHLSSRLQASLLILILAPSAFAGSVRLAWDPSSGPNVAGYMLYYGLARGSYSVGVNVGNFTTAALSGLQDGSTYYFVATAYDAYGKESAFSNEVSYTVPMANDTPPTVALISPLDGASVARKSTVTIGANAWDDYGVTKLEFYVNGSLVCANPPTSYTCAWKVPAAAGRTYQLQAKAYDTAGKAGSSSIITVQAQ
jgi:chitinase